MSRPTRHKKRIGCYEVGEAPDAVQDEFDYFVHRLGEKDMSDSGYCGAYCKRGTDRRHCFYIPGAIRKDGLFSDPLEARDALNKYLEGLKR